MINECLGVMDSITTTSYEKWILDDELLDRLRVFHAGINQIAAKNTLDEMILLGPGGDYLQQSSTLQNCQTKRRGKIQTFLEKLSASFCFD